MWRRQKRSGFSQTHVRLKYAKHTIRLEIHRDGSGVIGPWFNRNSRLWRLVFGSFCAACVADMTFSAFAFANDSPYADVQLKIDLGQLNDASLLLNKRSKDQGNPWFHYYQGRISSLRFKNEESLKHFTKAIQINPKHAKSFAARALVKGRMGDFSAALTDLDQAIAIDPGYAKAYSNRGVTRGAMQNNQAALADFSQAIRLDPRLADAYRNRGITREMVGDLKGACADWNIASALGQEGPKQWVAAQCK